MRREDTIPANPTMHSMPSSFETLDPGTLDDIRLQRSSEQHNVSEVAHSSCRLAAFLSQLQALRIKAIAASYLTPNTFSGLRADDFCSQHQNKV